MTTKEQVELIYQARKSKTVQLRGRFDRKSRWYPTEEEDSDNFTERIRTPSVANPFGYLKASQTKKHLTALAECNPEYFKILVDEVSKNLK